MTKKSKIIITVALVVMLTALLATVFYVANKKHLVNEIIESITLNEPPIQRNVENRGCSTTSKGILGGVIFCGHKGALIYKTTLEQLPESLHTIEAKILSRGYSISRDDYTIEEVFNSNQQRHTFTYIKSGYPDIELSYFTSSHNPAVMQDYMGLKQPYSLSEDEALYGISIYNSYFTLNY